LRADGYPSAEHLRARIDDLRTSGTKTRHQAPGKYSFYASSPAAI
jgi:hypothetical protein